jgi:protein SCO1
MLIQNRLLALRAILRRPWRSAFLFLALCAGCAPDPSWHLKSVAHLLPALQFQARQPDGTPITAGRFRGKVVLLYFGYTHCPDVCPTMLTKLSGIVHTMGPLAKEVAILFVSVDPARDTPADLKHYAAAFGPNVVGLHVDPDELVQLAKRYRVSYSLAPPDAHGDYEVAHSSGTFIFDRSGNARLVALAADPATAIQADVTRLAQEQGR